MLERILTGMKSGSIDEVSHASAMDALERFVIDNDDLLKLEERIGRFNVFDALGVVRAEIRHSNFLAWLLDPAESHGQGDAFLRAVLMDVLRGTPTNLRPVSPVDLATADLSTAIVRREWKNIDLLIVCDSPDFVVAVENKVDSGEHSGQLERYQKTLSEHFPQHAILHVFLTPMGESATDDVWVSYSYQGLHGVLTRARNAARSVIGTDVAVFLDHYLSLIGARFMNDPEIDRLCKAIYAKHRQAIDLIHERAGSRASGVTSQVEELLRSQDDQWRIRKCIANMVFFVPSKWIGSLSDADGEPSASSPANVFLETWASDEKLVLRLVVGPSTNIERRRRLIEKLLARREEFSLTHSKKSISDQWTRVYTKDVLVIDEEIDSKAIQIALEKRLADLKPVLEALPAIAASV